MRRIYIPVDFLDYIHLNIDVEATHDMACVRNYHTAQ